MRGFRRFGEPPATLGKPNVVNTLRQSILAQRPVALWPLNEPSGTVANELIAANNGAYAGTVTLAQNALGDGSLYPAFAGGRVSLATPLSALNTLFNTQAGTIVAWAKVSAAGDFTDGVTRFILHIGADANNRVYLAKSGSNNSLTFAHVAGGTSKNALIAYSSLAWFHLAMTWDKTADQVKAYLNGAQVGATLTGLGVWAGSLASTFTAISDQTSSGGTATWRGAIANPALFTRALTAPQIASMYVPGYAV